MERREWLKLAPCGILSAILRPRMPAEGRRIRRSKPYMEGLGRGSLSRAEIRRLEIEEEDVTNEAFMRVTLDSFGFGGD